EVPAGCDDPDGGAASGPPRVGWLGSDLSIRETLYPAWEMLGRVQRSLGFEFVICSRPRPVPPSDGLRWRFVEWSPETEERIARHVDIGIMPLVDEPFQRGKCGMKLLQYMAAGLPVVASPIGVNTSIVADGRTGFLAASEHEWHAALGRLVADAAMRRAFGLAGRARCDHGYSTRHWAGRLLEIFDRVARAA
ncbi:MAG: glycosyltransferase, partial [Actinobacteria bacterium]|nr:glycosyltransferase [Actinomycetota bacterium]